MDTGPWIGDVSHVFEKSTHLSNGEGIVRFDRATTSIEECKMIFTTLNGLKWSTIFRNVLEKIK